MDDMWVGVVSGAIGVVIGSVSAGLKDVVLSWMVSKKNAEYLSVRVVSVLDRFVDQCALVAQDSGRPDGQGCMCPQAGVPKLGFSALDVDWKSLPRDLMYEALDLDSRKDIADGKISEAAEFDGPPDYGCFFEERQFQYSSLGVRASNLADKLRKKFKIEIRDLSDWDPVEVVRNKKEYLQPQRDKRWSMDDITF